MIRKSVIQEFKIKNTQGFHMDNLSIPCEVQFPPRSAKQQIHFFNEGKEICFDLIYHRRKEIKHFKLMESSLINQDYLKKLGVEFAFKIIHHHLAKDILVGVIPDHVYKNGKTCYGALKKSDNQYYFMIYSKNGTTNFEDDIIYVFGIWEVDLPYEIEFKLFDPIKNGT